jgi:hypothetical protein
MRKAGATGKLWCIKKAASSIHRSRGMSSASGKKIKGTKDTAAPYNLIFAALFARTDMNPKRIC